MKWFWRYANEDQALWKEVIMSKYGQSSQWCTDEVVSTYNVSASLETYGQASTLCCL